MSLFTNLVYVFLAIGIFFNLFGMLGLHRFPDVYTRIHAATKCTTLGFIFIFFAVLSFAITLPTSKVVVLGIHSFVALIAILISNPTGAHAIARAAHRYGIEPKKAVVDKLREVED